MNFMKANSMQQDAIDNAFNQLDHMKEELMTTFSDVDKRKKAKKKHQTHVKVVAHSVMALMLFAAPYAGAPGMAAAMGVATAEAWLSPIAGSIAGAYAGVLAGVTDKMDVE